MERQATQPIVMHSSQAHKTKLFRMHFSFPGITTFSNGGNPSAGTLFFFFFYHSTGL